MKSRTSKSAPVPRGVLVAALAVLVPVHTWLMILWLRKWGFWGAIVHWLASAKLDPIYATAVVDFLSVMAFVGLWLLHDYRQRRGRVTLPFLAWCFLFLIFPSLAILVYFVWTRPGVADLTAARR